MAESQQASFNVRKIYVKDLSFETSYSSQMFVEAWNDWHPDVDLQLGSRAVLIKDNLHEIVLEMTVTAKLKDELTILVEMQLAGIFEILVPDQARQAAVMGGPCLQALFPFAREVVSDLVTRGGFPQLLLAPVNFNALYRQHLEEVNSEKTKT